MTKIQNTKYKIQNTKYNMQQLTFFILGCLLVVTHTPLAEAYDTPLQPSNAFDEERTPTTEEIEKTRIWNEQIVPRAHELQTQAGFNLEYWWQDGNMPTPNAPKNAWASAVHKAQQNGFKSGWVLIKGAEANKDPEQAQEWKKIGNAMVAEFYRLQDQAAAEFGQHNN